MIFRIGLLLVLISLSHCQLNSTSIQLIQNAFLGAINDRRLVHQAQPLRIRTPDTAGQSWADTLASNGIIFRPNNNNQNIYKGIRVAFNCTNLNASIQGKVKGKISFSHL